MTIEDVVDAIPCDDMDDSDSDSDFEDEEYLETNYTDDAILSLSAAPKVHK